MADLIKPEEFYLDDPHEEGKKLKFVVSNFPAVEGREIVTKYPMSSLPKLGDYATSEETMVKLMSYVAVPMPNGDLLRLSTRELINNHCRDWETLAKIEWKMMEKNCSFFQKGRSWDFLENFTQILLKKASEMLMRSSELSSPTEKQPSQS